MGSQLPKISIVTPSYNQAEFVEETILSVIDQDYPNVEYIIVDGGSTDGSVDIIRKYENRLAYWVSEPDEGQSHAINKGFLRSSGDILAWINSDDTYNRNTFHRVARFFSKNPDIDMIYSDCNYISETGSIIKVCRVPRFDLSKFIVEHNFIPQPTVFFKRSILAKSGLLDTSMHYSMDMDMWTRIAIKGKITRLDGVLANFRIHGSSKTSLHSLSFCNDNIRIYDRLLSNPDFQLPKKVKKQAYSRAFLAKGWKLYHLARNSEARKCWLRALREKPGEFLNLDLLFCFAKSFIPVFILEKVRKRRSRCSDKA